MKEPLFIALLFADRVIEESNHKKGIIGTFTHFYADSCPATFSPWFIYAAASNLSPNEPHTFSVNMIHGESRANVFSAGGELGVSKPNAVAELVLPVPNVVFPKFGEYTVEFNIDAKELISRNLQIIPRKAGG